MKKTLQTGLLVFAAFLALLGTSGCGLLVSGFGEVTECKFKFQGITQLEISSSFRVTVVVGETYDLSVRANKNLWDILRITSIAGRLHLGARAPYWIQRGTLEATLTIPTLTEVKVSGASRVILPNLFAKGKLRLDVSGASDLEIECLTADEIDVEISGASKLQGQLVAERTTWNASGASQALMKIHAKEARVNASGATSLYWNGEVTDLWMEVTGGSRGQMDKCRASSVEAHVSGGSEAVVLTDGRLWAEVSGGSSLYYIGEPALQKADASGGSAIRPYAQR